GARPPRLKWIAKIERRTPRLEDGTYGYCEETGEPIALKRLEARPIATLSVEAQERPERRESLYREQWSPRPRPDRASASIATSEAKAPVGPATQGTSRTPSRALAPTRHYTARIHRVRFRIAERKRVRRRVRRFTRSPSGCQHDEVCPRARSRHAGSDGR